MARHTETTVRDPSTTRSPDGSPGFSTETIEFLRELPNHTTDGEWHSHNKQRYQDLIRNPTRRLMKLLRERYVQKLNAEVASGSHQLSILKKNDYGKGGYHDHYWCAFYDPAAGSKTSSVQLFFRMIGSQDIWRYGFGMGHYCQPYIERLQQALANNQKDASAYMATAPRDTRVILSHGEIAEEWTAAEWAALLLANADQALGIGNKLDQIALLNVNPLAQLPARDAGLVDEIGDFFRWAWPFFEASRTGQWKVGDGPRSTNGEDIEVDDAAAESLQELSDQTSLPQDFLHELEEALLTKQQVVLVGPPGTSKTFLATRFARYFVRHRENSKQGRHHVVYMHANWNYENFFEGLKPVEKAGTLLFEQRPGFLLDWAEKLKEYDPSARHVLVLDEINRCDTAAVLGELLQLLEYRGTTVTLMSGRQFVFPTNVYLIGTMNSADRSIGRMDLALRRRFLWLNLYPQPDVLAQWLKRPGNNPDGFDPTSLTACNNVLAKKGIPKEQHIGHALFMCQEVTGDGPDAEFADKPLDATQLGRVVRFSVMPYVRELFSTHFGDVDESLLREIQELLLGSQSVGLPSQQSSPTAIGNEGDG